MVVTRELAGQAERLTAAHGAAARPLLRGSQDDLAAAQRRHRGSDDDHRRVAQPATRGRLRDRRRDGLAHAAARPRAPRPGRRRRAPRSACRRSSSRGSSTAPSRSARPRPSGARFPSAASPSTSRRRCSAQSCFAAGEAKCTYGTGAFILANAGERCRHARPRGWPPAWPGGLRGATTYCLDGQVHSAGVGGRLAGTRIGLIGERRGRSTQPRARIGTSCSCPGWRGSARRSGRRRRGAPGWGCRSPAAAATSCARWCGASRRRSPASREAIARDTGEPLRRLRVDGGLTRSARLMQAQADLLQAPVECYPSPDATARGVAALARLGAGGASTPEEAVGAWSPAAMYEPRMAAAGGPRAAASAGARRRTRWRSWMAEQASGAPPPHDVVDRGRAAWWEARSRASSRAFELRVRTAGGRRRRRRRDQQGQHGAAAHGLRRQPGTLEARLVRRGHELLSAYAPRAGIPLERVGALLVAWSEREQRAASRRSCSAPAATATTRSRELGREELYRRVPQLGAGRAGGAGGARRGHRVHLHHPAGVRDRGDAGGLRAAAGLPRRRRRARPPAAGSSWPPPAGRCGPASSSTPPACSATSSTACSATTTSPSRRGAAS